LFSVLSVPIPRLAATLCRILAWRDLAVAVLVLGLMAVVSGKASAGSLVAGDVGVLDNLAFAVDAAESRHGDDPNMWRSEANGPQGPMQVSAAAAADVGGGDRFDLAENRMLGRAYLARLYQRYANWSDAVAAYNWGPGNMDAWINAGRPIAGFPIAVSLYRIRVLYGSGAPFGEGTTPRFGGFHLRPRRSFADRRHPSHQSIAVEQLYGAIIADSERVIH
jgi:Transglycosylase SLT domain